MAEFARGEIVLVSSDPVLGHEQAKRRPCVVVSSTVYNTRSPSLVVVPMTSKIKGYPFEVVVKTTSIQGAALVDQIRTVDAKARNAISAGETVSFQELHQIQAKLDALLFR